MVLGFCAFFRVAKPEPTGRKGVCCIRSPPSVDVVGLRVGFRVLSCFLSAASGPCVATRGQSRASRSLRDCKFTGLYCRIVAKARNLQP